MQPLGLIFGCGAIHQRTRRAATTILQRVGFYNTSKLEALAKVQASQFMRDLTHDISTTIHGQHNSSLGLWCPKHKTNYLATNMLWELLFGRQQPKDQVAINTILGGVHSGNIQYRMNESTTNMLTHLVARVMNPLKLTWVWYRSSMETYRIINVCCRTTICLHTHQRC